MNTIGRHFSDPPIEIVSESPRLQLLQSRLSFGGMRPIRATQPLRTHSEIPLLIDMLVNPAPDMIARFVEDWSACEERRDLVVLGPLPEQVRETDVVQIETADCLIGLKDRISIRRREAVRRRELELRSVTARMLGANETGPMSARKAQRLLYLGEGSKHFGALKSTLLRSQVELVAALTHLTAMDYLSQQAFDGILLEPSNADDEAAKFLSRLEDRPDPDDLQLMLLEQAPLPEALNALIDTKHVRKLDASQPVADLVSDILQHLCQPREDEVPREHSLQSIHDRATGLFSRQFLKTHLVNLMNACDETGQPLSLLYMTPKDGNATLREIALRVSNALRESDLAARIDARTICVVMPNTAYHAALLAASRLEDVCEGMIDWTLIERRQTHTAEGLTRTQTEQRRAWARKRSA